MEKLQLRVGMVSGGIYFVDKLVIFQLGIQILALHQSIDVFNCAFEDESLYIIQH